MSDILTTTSQSLVKHYYSAVVYVPYGAFEANIQYIGTSPISLSPPHGTHRRGGTVCGSVAYERALINMHAHDST